MVGPKEIRATFGALNNACGTSVKVDYTAYAAAAGKTTGELSMSLPIIVSCCPN